MPNIILYIAASLDGVIAQENDDLSFLKMVEDGTEDYGYQTFYDSIDTIILGKRTYDWVVKEVGFYPHLDRMNYVYTRQTLPPQDQLTFYNGDLKSLVADLKDRDSDKNIFCNGGSHLVNKLLKINAIDEIILSIVPTILGNGTRLFQHQFDALKLKLESSKSFKSGLVQLHYSVLK